MVTQRGTRDELLQVDDLVCVLRRRPVRRVSLRVGRVGGAPQSALGTLSSVVLTAPAGMREFELRRFVRTNRSWIDRCLAEERRRDIAVPQLDWSEEQIAWAKARLAELVPALIASWTRRLDLPRPTWTPRLMRTRWGSCTPATRRIRFSLELARYDDAYVEYVVVHELVHLRVHNHGAEFQAMMSAALPAWRRLRAALGHPRADMLAPGGRECRAQEPA
ncbi:M48 family metallopeptidase [Pseudoclavibacter sp. CFCC 13796]|uniref:M48 family metallopeptidase n=1 Tax=Pseudoclavibacter sp. CFCC 13796 TaxID=2615179 RepID=UPI001300FEB2|nr:M48 family metallopeptidase [Pseudoclavibacter sp. CFCC 13796]KAB1661471.1 M48 family metallopeptidase [Pseudoclavibacter sp. CFCC 13796]